jgi:4-diphosphocytidyl-2-C-methyl-D-erythritol kinase
MGADASRGVTVIAPAKLNLGLEVVGRRPDGYHDLVTVFQTVDLVDRLTLSPAAALRLACDDPTLATSDNLALAALAALRARSGTSGGARIDLTKGIPVAAGLGGASSDAAAALLGARRLWGVGIADATLADLASGLGSDVPFFLRGGTALATGRGERLEPLPSPAARFVVVSPRLVIPRKTATLYGALTASDFSDGTRVRRQAARLREGKPLDPDLLVNPFARAFYALRPELADLPLVLRRHGAPAVALSGAGPSHYAVLPDPEAATHLAAALTDALGNAARVFVAAPFVQPDAPVAT